MLNLSVFVDLPIDKIREIGYTVLNQLNQLYACCEGGGFGLKEAIMKAVVNYSKIFIPSNLPHAMVDGEGDEIYGDYVHEVDGVLVLGTNCGETKFSQFVSVNGGWEVEGDASFEGAWAAFNACTGVKFGEFVVSKLESSLGKWSAEDEQAWERGKIIGAYEGWMNNFKSPLAPAQVSERIISKYEAQREAFFEIKNQISALKNQDYALFSLAISAS